MAKPTTDHSGKLSKRKISNLELICTCLRNAPEGTDKEQVLALLKLAESGKFPSLEDN